MHTVYMITENTISEKVNQSRAVENTSSTQMETNASPDKIRPQNLITSGIKAVEGAKDVLSADAIKIRRTDEEYFKFGRGLKSYVVKLKSPNASSGNKQIDLTDGLSQSKKQVSKGSQVYLNY